MNHARFQRLAKRLPRARQRRSHRRVALAELAVDRQVSRLLEESVRGREQSVQEIRSEIRLLARTIAALAEEADQRE